LRLLVVQQRMWLPGCRSFLRRCLSGLRLRKELRLRIVVRLPEQLRMQQLLQ